MLRGFGIGAGHHLVSDAVDPGDQLAEELLCARDHLPGAGARLHAGQPALEFVGRAHQIRADLDVARAQQQAQAVGRRVLGELDEMPVGLGIQHELVLGQLGVQGRQLAHAVALLEAREGSILAVQKLRHGTVVRLRLGVQPV